MNTDRWFSFDGETFETHETEELAKHQAERAMEWWAEDASEGWDELSTQVCYGKITHAVVIDRTPVTDETRHLVPHGCDDTEFERHRLEAVETPPGA